MKRNDISGLKNNRPIAFKMGFACSLLFVIMAFNISVDEANEEGKIFNQSTTNIEDVEVIRTKHKKPLPPPELVFKEKFEPVKEITFHEPTEPVSISLDIDADVDPNFIDDGMGTDDFEIEPEVEDPVDFLDEEPILDVAEYMPSFGDCNAYDLSKEKYKECSDIALLKYFSKNIRYPSLARENGIEGKVILQFVIDENGNVILPKVARGVSGGCSEEALRVLQNMPKWKAGKHKGRNVKVNFTLPVSFQLQGS